MGRGSRPLTPKSLQPAPIWGRGLGILLALIGFLAIPGSARAQDPTLASVEQLAASGRLTDARATLERWNQEHPESASVPGDVRAHALLLAARLAVDPGAAEAGYLAVALGYPSSAHAPQALLRLGQGLVLAAEAGTRADCATRAVAFLERLVTDYPGSPHRAPGLLWLVRAKVLGGHTERACAIARDALGDNVEDADVDDMLRIEFASHCDGAPPQSAATVPSTTADADPPPAGARFTVQAGAMSEPARADALAASLRAAGYDPRTVLLQGSRLVRVRVGRFSNIREAEALAARIRAARFEAVVVGDAHHEIAR